MTYRMTTRVAAALGLACAFLTASCSEDVSLTEPISAPAYSYQQSASADGGELELVESDITWTATRGWATIGRKGGTVVLWAHTPAGGGYEPYHSLVVPPGTVKKPTYFVIEIGADPVIDVYLTATEISSDRPITEFDKPLTLTLTYSGSSVEQPENLRVVHVVDGIITETVQSTVDTSQEVVIGEIWHFSRYAVAVE